MTSRLSDTAATLTHVTTLHPGLFLSFEGGDGAGKSTQARLLGDWLTGLGREVVLTREPGGTELGVLLRDAVLHGDHVDARTEALLYATDRAHHVASLVRPALVRGAVVVTDRYLDSSVAYQGSGRALGADEVVRLSLWAVDGLLPALTVLLDLDPVAGQRRANQRRHVVRAVGRVEQRLGAGVDVVAVQDRVAQQHPELRAARFPRQDDLAAEPGQPLTEQTGLRRLAGAVATLEGEEEARVRRHVRQGSRQVRRHSPG